MSAVKILNPSAGDVEHIAHNLRQGDREELFAAHGTDPVQQVFDAWANCPSTCCFYCRDEPALLLGHSPDPTHDGVGIIWAVGTDLVDVCARSLIKAVRPMCSLIVAEYRHGLVNMVHAKNTKSIRYLKASGFQLFDPVTAGPFNESFIPFWFPPCAPQQSPQSSP